MGVARVAETGLLDGIHDVVQIKAAGFLSRRKLSETVKPLRNVGTSGREGEHVLKLPFRVANSFLVSSFKRIRTTFMLRIFRLLLPVKKTITSGCQPWARQRPEMDIMNLRPWIPIIIV